MYHFLKHFGGTNPLGWPGDGSCERFFCSGAARAATLRMPTGPTFRSFREGNNNDPAVVGREKTHVGA